VHVDGFPGRGLGAVTLGDLGDLQVGGGSPPGKSISGFS
jgi:hypothetical protein